MAVWMETRVDSLLTCSVEQVISVLPMYMETVETLPPNLKDRILQLMTKRGLANDQTLSTVLHPNVKTIDLSECDISDDGLHIIASKCPHLRKIDLNSAKQPRTNITDYGITALVTHCIHLQAVYLRRCLHVTDDSIGLLAQRCQYLRDLNIGGCTGVTDNSLIMLGQNCPYLRSVNFGYANVTDDGIFALTQGVCSNTLQEIHMNGCKEVTDESVESIVQFCPKINVLIFHTCPKLTEKSREALEQLMERQEVMKQVTWTVY